jgi:death-on-curing protein
MVRYLKPQEILVIHAKLIDEIAGSHGVRDIGLLLSLVERPRARFNRKELYRGAFKKAAVYLESLANYHVFIDGNKRTAITVAARFLFLNGYELQVSNKQLERFILKVATKKPDLEVIAEWLRSNSRKIKTKKTR